MAVDDNFSDVSKDAYYYNEVGIAKKLGIVKGTGNNNFKPEDPITREEMMVIISRVLNICNAKVEKGDKNELAIYNDRDMISEYAIEDVATLIKNGIIKGSQNNIKPKAITTRAEAAVVIYRLVNLLLN
ncbi:S-layer homology domain-containing protein [Caldicellulosiruptor acetigenus]|uniref:S-layer homology domain-containing protein n=1 Tax=Caldicellulosiruptor acetigenus TaxID=301953 RepID=UPI00041128A0|nr:S-layer homology domain-containing protein [Caldicellulosiruptor acetigenus]WAM36354.1 S-layer homology domain-containing protein [Caldicellulosiruptor acetigenus]